jgi:translation initiation factor IF-2
MAHEGMSAQEFGLQKDKVRIYQLARDLNIETKDLVDLCRNAGIDVKNQLSSLDPDQRDMVEALVKKGGAVAVAAPPPPKPVVSMGQIDNRVRDLGRGAARREAPVAEAPRPAPAAAAAAPPKPVEAPVARPVEPPPAPAAARVPEVAVPKPAEVPEVPAAAARAPEPKTPEAPPQAPRPPEARPPMDLSPKPPPTLGRPHDAGRPMRDLSQPREGDRTQRRPPPRPSVASRPALATPPPLRQRTLKDAVGKAKVQQPIAPVQKPIAKPPEALTGQPVNIQKILDKTATDYVPPSDAETEDDDGKKRAGGGGPGAIPGRDKRHQQRQDRARARKSKEEELKVTRLPSDDDDRPHRKYGWKQRLQQRKNKEAKPERSKKIFVTVPITVRALSEALGLRSGDLLFKLMGHGAPPTITINSNVEPDMAQLVAMEIGTELEIRKAQDVEEKLLPTEAQADKPEDLVPRAPIVTIMGHVDHGKTSLLDKIRKSNVVATEAGGITQVIRAWRVDHNGRPVTFLDTPGHEAFTKMRARGAQVTDIAVIVVAADDGVMPQTEEAINHAKAAGVPIVVAINKVDLPNANLNKTRQQLYGMSLIPDSMGGDTPFVETSAATGKGIDELLDMLSLVAEMKELKANPNKRAKGTCLESMLNEGEGVMATLLVQEGTLHKGDVIVCGASYGRVRAMYDDLGRPIEEAGPSVPVRITGLDEVPNADDPFQVLDDLALAREVGEKRKERQLESSIIKRTPARLETLGQAKIAELKVILKADFKGSIEAIRKELEKLQHEEVRVRVLHAAIGAITESDVQLALTSPEDSIIVGFNVVPDDRALRLAEEKGVQLREYDIIYNLTNDIRAALEGKLKPREEVIHLGRAVVRETFKISRVGTIAGCYVTQGTIERSAKVRLIRGGVVIYPPTDRTASLESLKRFKDDAREVREGFECGMKIAGYDDVKVDDVIEAYRIEQVQRTL